MKKEWILVKNTYDSKENRCVLNIVISKDFDLINNTIIDDGESVKNGMSIKHFCCCDYCNGNAMTINNSIRDAFNYWADKSTKARKDNADAACFIVATNLEDYEYCSDEADEYETVEELLNDCSSGCSDGLMHYLNDRILDPVVSPIWY